MNEVLAQICKDVGTLNGKMDVLLSSDQNRITSLANHDLRIRKLEKKWAWLTGIFTLGGVGLAALKALFRKSV